MICVSVCVCVWIGNAVIIGALHTLFKQAIGWLLPYPVFYFCCWLHNVPVTIAILDDFVSIEDIDFLKAHREHWKPQPGATDTMISSI